MAAVVYLDDTEIKKKLRLLLNLAGDLSPALRVIGLDLVESTKQRFETGVAPDGSPWAANTAATLLKKSGENRIEQNRVRSFHKTKLC